MRIILEVLRYFQIRLNMTYFIKLVYKWNPVKAYTTYCIVFFLLLHYDDVIMSAITSQITSLTIVYSIVYSDADQRKHQSYASLAFVWGIHRDRWIIHRDRWIPRTNGQLRGKCFHLMTSSWCTPFHNYGTINSYTLDAYSDNTGGRFYYSKQWFILIPVCKSKLTTSNLWHEISYPLPNFNDCTVEVWEWISNFISHFIMDAITDPHWGQS